jgi:SnoaL-like domain
MSTHAEIAALNADYWLRVDQRRNLPVADLYVEDGLLRVGSLELAGRSAIAGFFTARNREQTASGRRTRHLQANLDLESAGADRVVCRSTVAVFAGCGKPPLEVGGPSTIADAEDVCVRTSDGGWRFESRRLLPVFVGAGAAGFTRS